MASEVFLCVGCMSASGLDNLVFIDGIMNHSVYLGILRDNLKLLAQNLDIVNNFIFYHDNDPEHTALNVRHGVSIIVLKIWKYHLSHQI